VLKTDLKPAIAAINQTLLTTLAACGDVARNVMSTAAPRRDAIHARLDADAAMLSRALLPQSRAYHQIFLGEESATEEAEPLYGATYLPRKFKIAIAEPSDNTVDVLTNDLGLIALFEGDALLGYNVAVGGGLGMTHNRPDTYPRLASVVGFVGANELLAVTEAVIRLQRDHGDRGDRKRARLKYLVDDQGLDWVTATLGEYLGHRLEAPRPMPPLQVPDLLGWHNQGDGGWWLGIPVSSGRVADVGTMRLRSGLRSAVRQFGVDPVMTPQQDVLLTNVKAVDRAAIETLLREYGVEFAADQSLLSRWTLACPALPTCGLALTEAERVRSALVADLDAVLARHGLTHERIGLRVSGCPNACARSYAGDIGLVGRVPGAYALYVGGDFASTRLSFKLLERVKQADIAARLEPLFEAFAAGRQTGEGFGDFCHRAGLANLLELIEVRASDAA
jgi:sulfite reductase (ferredoxin)